MNTVLETMGSCRATRRFRADAVPRSLIERCIWAATRAPSPRNLQPWRFVAVDSLDLRRQLHRIVGAKAAASRRLAEETDDPELRDIALASAALVDDLTAVPVIVVVCGKPIGGPPEHLWSALYGATQNFIVAARSLGLGTVVTTMHLVDPGAVRTTLGIPPDHELAAMIPCGWPVGHGAPVRRRPLSDAGSWNHWQSTEGFSETGGEAP